MKRLLTAFVPFVLVACSGSPAPAASVTGQWQGGSSDGELFRMDLTQNGTAVTGTFGYGRTGGNRVGPITGTFAQGRVALVVTGEGFYSGSRYTLTGELKDGRLAGDFVFSRGNTNDTYSYYATRVTATTAQSTGVPGGG